MRIFLNNPLHILCLSVFFISLSPLKTFAADTENDPFEKTNRAIFEFNNTLDDNFFKPVAKAWRKVPDFPRNLLLIWQQLPKHQSALQMRFFN